MLIGLNSNSMLRRITNYLIQNKKYNGIVDQECYRTSYDTLGIFKLTGIVSYIMELL